MSALADRDGFPLVRDRTYLNSAAKGALGRAVRGSITGFTDQWDRYGAPWEMWLGELAGARSLFARLVHCAPEQVFVSSSVSAAVSTLVSALDYSRRPELLVIEDDFPTLADVALAAERLGARVRVIALPEHGPADAAQAVLTALDAALTERVAAVLVSGVHHAARYELPIREVVRSCHAVGALCVVDGYHQAGVVATDVADSGVDAWTSGCMKYLLGSPGGLTLTYCGDPLLRRATRPLAVGWLGTADPFASTRTAGARREDAAGFESGLPSLLCAAAARAGLEQVLAWDGQAVERHVRSLVADTAEGLTAQARRTGRRSAPALRTAGAMLCVRVDGIEAALRMLDGHGVLAGSWRDWLRVSFHAYSDRSDVRRFVEVAAAGGLLERMV